MARQNIDLGTTPNDGTGTTLRDGGDLINDNFTELYSVAGWGFYVDSETSPTTQTITTTPIKLQVDGAGGTSESGYLPREIRGISELWDTTNDKIIAITLGDGYDIRIDLEITGKTSNPNVIDVIVDIGGAAGITIPIVETEVPVIKSVPFSVSIALPLFSLSTFLTNGGQIFLATDVGTLTVASRSILIKRDFKGDL
jgi:hypothetical protein